MRTAAVLFSLAASFSLRAAAGCPEDRRLDKLDLDAWKAALKAAAPGSDEQRKLLERLGMKKVPSGSDEIPDADCAQKPVVKGVDVFAAPLAAPGAQDKLVQVRFALCEDDAQSAFQSVRAVVLLAQGAQAYCRAGGDDLSKDQADWDAPCLGPKASKLPRTFEFTNLTDPKRKTLKVSDRAGPCKSGDSNADFSATFFDVQDTELRKIFETKTYASSASGGEAPAEETVWKLEAGKKFPKPLTVTEQHRCLKESGCKPSSQTRRYAFKGGAYSKLP